MNSKHLELINESTLDLKSWIENLIGALTVQKLLTKTLIEEEGWRLNIAGFKKAITSRTKRFNMVTFRL